MKRSAVDNLSFLFIGGLVWLTLACHGLLHATTVAVFGVLLTLALAILITQWWASRTSLGDTVHAFLPVLLLPVLFNTLGPIIDCVNAHRWDATFSQVDASLFGQAALHWHLAFGRPWWLTDLTYIMYVSYYALPLVLGVILYRQGRRADFDELVMTVVTCFYLSYVGYLIFPTFGPRVPIGDETTVLGGGAISHGVRAFLHFAERTTTDAFPSGHTAVALVCLFLGWRHLPTLRVPLTLVVAGIIFTTVYLHYHYVVDVVAGVALGIATPRVAHLSRRLLEPPLLRRWMNQLSSEQPRRGDEAG
jgi:membrane-associated phospholipid phosphatase